MLSLLKTIEREIRLEPFEVGAGRINTGTRFCATRCRMQSGDACVTEKV